MSRETVSIMEEYFPSPILEDISEGVGVVVEGASHKAAKVLSHRFPYAPDGYDFFSHDANTVGELTVLSPCHQTQNNTPAELAQKLVQVARQLGLEGVPPNLMFLGDGSLQFNGSLNVELSTQILPQRLKIMGDMHIFDAFGATGTLPHDLVVEGTLILKAAASRRYYDGTFIIPPGVSRVRARPRNSVPEVNAA